MPVSDVAKSQIGKELAQISKTGEHEYVVYTRVWLLPARGLPKLLIDVPGLLSRLQRNDDAGLWINRETYDGHAETKGHRMEFWAWDSVSESFKRR